MIFCRDIVVLLLALVVCIFASIETETKYTIISEPGNSNTPSTNTDDENVSSTVITNDDSNSMRTEDNLDEDISINVLQNGKTILEKGFL